MLSATQILLGLLLVCWVGFPLLLLGALVWQLARSFAAFRKRRLPIVPAPDTDLMA